MTCEFNSSSDVVIMEVPGPANRASQDSEPCTIKQMMIEMESAGLVDLTLNGHKLERSAGMASRLAASVFARMNTALV